MTHIEIDTDRCTGCRSCEQVCAFAHENMFGPARARLRVYRRDVLTFEAKVCTHCIQAYCVAACPSGALVRQEDRTVFDAELCTGCGTCVEECDRLFWDAERLQPLICDLCMSCVNQCPEQAIKIVQ